MAAHLRLVTTLAEDEVSPEEARRLAAFLGQVAQLDRLADG